MNQLRKYEYKRLPMGMRNYLEKLQDIFLGYEFIPVHTYKILVLIKVDWDNYLKRLKLTLNKLKLNIIK